MAETEAEPTVAERLGRLLDRGLLPAGGPAEAAERLIERLQRPARVALLGLPGSGKSAILNLLAGTVVVPETLRLPTMIVQHGDVARMLCTLSDGRTEIVQGTNLEKSLTLSPALITLELDLPALKVISLLEVAAGSMESDQRRAALWAGKRADILIWCTTAYLPKEQLVWEGMPDSYKDNGFLLLTKVDLLGGREAASGMQHRVEQRASGEFRQVLSISAKEARVATLNDGSIDRDRFRESGAAAVISTIKSRVQMARRADEDTAELILARHGDAVETPTRPPAEPTVSAPVPTDRLTAENLAAEAAALERVAAATASVVASAESAPTISVVRQPEPTPIPEPVSVEPSVAATPDHEPEATQPAPDLVSESARALVREHLAAETAALERVAAAAASVVVSVESTPEPQSFKAPDPEPELIQSGPAPQLSAEPTNTITFATEPEPDLNQGSELEPVHLVEEPEPFPEDDVVPAAFDDRISGNEIEATTEPNLPFQHEPEVILHELTSAEVPLSDAQEALESTEESAEAEPLANSAAGLVEAEPREGSARFTARLKQIPKSGDATASGLVPLRATWKSRTDATDLMPIEPKPAPNKNLTPRPRITDSANEARLVGKIVRPGESSGPASPSKVGAAENGPETPTDGNQPSNAATASDATTGRLPGTSTETDRRFAKPTSVFGSRPRPEPAKEAEAEPTVDDMFPPLPELVTPTPPAEEVAAILPTVSDEPVPVEATHESSLAIEDAPAVEEMEQSVPTLAPEPEPESEPVPEPEAFSHELPEPEAPRRSLSNRLGVSGPGPGAIRRDVPNAVRVSRIAGSPHHDRFTARPAALRPADTTPMPSPQDIVAPRVTVSRVGREDGASTERRERPRIAPRVPPTESTMPSALQELPAAEKLLIDQAVSLIMARSTELLDKIDPAERIPVDLILENCRETVDQVQTILNRGGTTHMRRIGSSLGEVQDLIMLMQLERGHAPADDALTLLLQLRREMETLRIV